MLRITRIDRNDGSVVLKLDGRLVDQWVELLRETREILRRETDKPLILDLSEVRFASKEGIELLRHLQKDGVGCVSLAPFLRALGECAS